MNAPLVIVRIFLFLDEITSEAMPDLLPPFHKPNGSKR